MNEIQTVKVGETDKGVANVEAWAAIIEDLLYLVPNEKRADVLALAVAKEEAARKERARNAALSWIMTAAEMADTDDPGIRHWNVIMRLKSLIVQVFVRDIRNDHSPHDAARLLFAHHRHGAGSGDLQDYLDNLK